MLKVRNWSKFQHYKRRRPPWIKLHRELLEDRKFLCLPLASQALAPRVWLLASESDTGTISADPVELAFRLRCSEADLVSAVKPLIVAGFLEGQLGPASNALAGRKQVATPETEGETETEGEKRNATAKPSPTVTASDWNREAADDFMAVYGAAPPKLFFAQVKPVAKKYGWGKTRPALKAYMAETPIEFLNIAKCLAVKVDGTSPSRTKQQSRDEKSAAAIEAFTRKVAGQ